MSFFWVINQSRAQMPLGSSPFLVEFERSRTEKCILDMVRSAFQHLTQPHSQTCIKSTILSAGTFSPCRVPAVAKGTSPS